MFVGEGVIGVIAGEGAKKVFVGSLFWWMDFNNTPNVRGSLRRLPKEERERKEAYRKRRREELIMEHQKTLERGRLTWQMKVYADDHGKKVNIVDPVCQSETDYYPFGDLKFLQRSNEIRELLKTKQDAVYGLTYVDTEARFCDAPDYDSLLDLIKVYKRNYTNTVDVKEYTKEQGEACQRQSVFAEFSKKQYDLGYKCFDDYVDPRYKYDKATAVSVGAHELQEMTCGIDGCTFKCYELTVMTDHKLRHDNKEAYPFPCLQEGCLHRCTSRVQLKRHMLTHCKHIHPCNFLGCKFIGTDDTPDLDHLIEHTKRSGSKRSLFFGRKLCYICHTMVRHFGVHRKEHPEFMLKCPYPGCKRSFGSSMHWFRHCDGHILDVIRKIESNHYSVSLTNHRSG